MASTLASSIHKSFKYDVFLSFRGEDTRKTFVGHLYHALHQKSINTYKDDKRIEKGEKISEQLIGSINESRFYIIVFSKNYADSSWCLNELVEIMECQKMEEQTAYPIFYDVEPTEVRNQSGEVEKAFAKQVNNESAGKWRDALKEASNLAGWELKNTFDGDQAPFIQKIVKDILQKLHSIHYSIDKNLVGMETRVKKVIETLQINSEDDVLMIGIKGMGGGGKTTLARAVFDHISFQFEGKSFVENVKDSSLTESQKQILSDVLNDPEVVNNASDGKNKMSSRIRCRKVLIVLDDVDHISQLEALAGEATWFKPGSRIIITTRDEQVMKAHRVNFIHDIELLSHEEAICLFTRHSVGGDIPVKRFEDLSRQVVHYAAGLPLTIKALGSHLCRKTEDVWVDVIDKLKRIPFEETAKRLRLSYDGLEKEQKEIFLDVACILKGEPEKKAIRVLNSCEFNAIADLDVLKQKSLITISNDGCLGLHNHIEEMGRYIVRHLHDDEPHKHSRLWIKEEIEEILIDKSGTEATRSIKLLNTMLTPDEIMEGLSKMTKLRFIHVDNGCVEYVVPPSDNNIPSLPNALRYLYWRNYPFSCLPKTFAANNLVNLEMVGSKISEIWKGEKGKVFKKLKFLNLKKSNLKGFDLETAKNLEMLDLRKCNDFKELQMTIKFSNLKFLYLSGFKVISNLNLNRTPNLEKLTLSLNEDQHLPENICTLKSLKSLRLKSCWNLEELPEEISRLKSLVELHLTECSKLKDVPSSICEMTDLKSLHLPNLGAEKLPEKLGNLKNLKVLNIEGATITHLPISLLEVKGLNIVWSKGRLEQFGFTSFTEISKYTASCYI